MIIFDIPKFIKREKEKIYLKSKSIPIDFGVFCDYSKTEDLVRIEETTGERVWYNIAPFFWDYPIRVERYIGVAIGSRILTYQITSIEPRTIRGGNLLYALLSPCGSERAFDFKKDYPLNKLDHELAMNKTANEELPF